MWERIGEIEGEFLRRCRQHPAGTRATATIRLRFQGTAAAGGKVVGQYGLKAAMPVPGGPNWARLFTTISWLVGSRVPHKMHHRGALIN
jgi:hypothetical protein